MSVSDRIAEEERRKSEEEDFEGLTWEEKHIDLNGDYWESPLERWHHWEGYWKEMEKD